MRFKGLEAQILYTRPNGSRRPVEEYSLTYRQLQAPEGGSSAMVTCWIPADAGESFIIKVKEDLDDPESFCAPKYGIRILYQIDGRGRGYGVLDYKDSDRYQASHRRPWVSNDLRFCNQPVLNASVEAGSSPTGRPGNIRIKVTPGEWIYTSRPQKNATSKLSEYSDDNSRNDIIISARLNHFERINEDCEDSNSDGDYKPNTHGRSSKRKMVPIHELEVLEKPEDSILFDFNYRPRDVLVANGLIPRSDTVSQPVAGLSGSSTSSSQSRARSPSSGEVERTFKRLRTGSIQSSNPLRSSQQIISDTNHCNDLVAYRDSPLSPPPATSTAPAVTRDNDTQVPGPSGDVLSNNQSGVKPDVQSDIKPDIKQEEEDELVDDIDLERAVLEAEIEAKQAQIKVLEAKRRAQAHRAQAHRAQAQPAKQEAPVIALPRPGECIDLTLSDEED